MANSSAIGDWKFWLAVQTRKTAPRGSERRRRDQKLAHSGGERKRSRKGGKALEIEESPVGGGTNIRSGGQKRWWTAPCSRTLAVADGFGGLVPGAV